MKKIGNITCSVGLILYGVWLLLKNYDYSFSMEILKWWPVIFIILGCEIIFLMNHKTEEQKIKINYLIIPVILVFLFTSGYYSAKNKLNSFINLDGMNLDGLDWNIDGSNEYKINFTNDSKKLPVEKLINKYGNSINIIADNSKIKIANSDDDNIKISGNVYVDKDSNIDKYIIKEEKTNDGYKISFDESYIDGPDITLYLPKGYYAKIKGDNSKIDADNYTGNVDVDCDNSAVDLEGDIKICKVTVNNGKISLKNKECKDVEIETKNGVISVDTQDSNLNVNADIDDGICKLNGDKRVNSGITQNIGNGSGSLKVNANNGVVSIKTRE